MSEIAADKIGSRIFEWPDQLAYARLTGDVNPLHMDKTRARRTIIGDIAVHGMHSLTWALECLAKATICPVAIISIDVRFPKPLHLGEEVSLFITKIAANVIHLKASVGTKTVAQIKIDTGLSSPVPPQVEDNPGSTRKFSLEEKTQTLDFAKATECSGKVEFTATVQSFADQFSDVAKLVDPRILRGLGACSRLVGMICPGSYSVFSRLKLAFSAASLNEPLSYKTVEADDRFLLIRQEVAGCGMQGQAESFAPAPPPKQMDCPAIAPHLQKGEFSGQRALVVGGSRGLGELAAKIIATGAGTVLLTYASGKEDADTVAHEIAAAGGGVETLHFNINEDNSVFLDKIAAYRPTHIYYFATCRIAKQKSAEFEPDKLAAFMHYYVHAFADLCCHLSAISGNRKVSVYYPSSVYVTDRPSNMTEYAMAKAAGEVLCADMSQLLPNLSVHVQRLPKLLTDQTNALTQQSLPNPLAILLPVFRLMK